ncbi:MAG: universal stress protein [Anaerolineales bacterium]|jgi:nucleotide-binding universal stress UspA family protein
MAKILCAIRGGNDSQRIQDIGIELAKERGEGIVFLYVVNTEFLATASTALRESVTNEMEKLGDFLLLMAQERAKRQGVFAETVLRHGFLQEEFEAAACELDISIVLLGKPGVEGNFSMESLEHAAVEIEEKCQVKVMIC